MDLIASKNTYYMTNENGEVLEIDAATGAIVNSSPSLAEVYEKGEINAEMRKGGLQLAYSQAVADIICQKVAEGVPLSRLTKFKGFPSYAVLSRWRAENKTFDAAIMKAKKFAAERYHDEVVESLEKEGILSKEEVPGAKHKFEKLKWLSAVNDPDNYGNRTKVSGDKDNPLQIIIDTGIRRD